MKQLNVLLLVVMGLWLVACENKDVEVEKYIFAEAETEYLIPGAGKTVTIPLNTNVDEKDIRISISEEWLHAELSDGSVSVEIDGNTGTGERSAEVQLDAETLEQPLVLKFKQAAAKKYIAVENASPVNVPAEGKIFDIAYTTNVSDVKVELSKITAGDWIDVIDQSGKIRVEVLANPTIEERKASVYLSAEGVYPIVVEIVQSEASGNISIDGDTEFSVSADGEVLTVTYSTNLPQVKAASNVNWIWASCENGIMTITVLQNVEMSARNAEVRIFAEGSSASQVIKITQAAAKALIRLEFQPVLEIYAEGQLLDYLEVTSNVSSKIRVKVQEGAESWIEAGYAVDSWGGGLYGYLTINVKPNASSEPRTATVTLYAEGADDAVVTIKQAGAK